MTGTGTVLVHSGPRRAQTDPKHKKREGKTKYIVKVTFLPQAYYEVCRITNNNNANNEQRNGGQGGARSLLV